jgi:hypothetical protein
MSIFHTTQLPCPACGTKVDFETVHSVNADRRPDLRDAIRSGEFQRETCPSCQTLFRLDPQFTYIDQGQRSWIAVFPLDDLAQWREREAEVRATYDLAFGAGAPAPARAIGKQLRPRLVFGWPALREKLATSQHRLDDLQLELMKIGLLRSGTGGPLGDTTELRFLEVSADGKDELVLAWIESRTAEFVQGLRVPRQLYDDVAAEAEDWQDLRESLAEGLFVDMKRLITVGA